MKKLLILVWLLALPITSAYADRYGIDAPHDATNAISCFDCHLNLTITKPTDDRVCLQCHVNSTGGGYRKNTAPKVLTHSSTTTSTKYGTWTALCIDCHGVHLQEQRFTYSSNTYLGTGAITSVKDNGNGTTTFGYSNFVASPNRSAWADYTKWGAKTGNERGLIIDIYPHPADFSINFEILSATANTITTKGSILIYPAGAVTAGSSTFVLTYGQNVVAALQYPTTKNPYGVPIRFFDKTGPNSFAYDESLTHTDPTPDGVCQVCHDRTSHFKRDGTLAAVGVHSGLNGSNCTMCHTHKDGFSAKGACNACHGYPPINNSLGGPDGLAYNDGGTGSASSGAHAKHATSAGANYPCETCHKNGMPATPVYDKLIQIGFSLPDGSTGGSYDGRATLANNYKYAPGNLGTTITQGGTQRCSVTCHGSSNPSWTEKDTSQDCTFCHGGNASSVSPIATGAHLPHIRNAAVTGTNYDCAQCHNTTVSAGNDRVITNPANHANGVKDVSMPRGGTWNSSIKTCTTTYCHSSGKGTYAVVPAWGSGTPLGCNGCHGTSTATGAPDYANAGAGQPNANSHGKHVSTSADCSICHTNTTTNGIAIKAGSALHTNHAIDVTFDATKAGTGATWTAGTKTCTNISCHGSGAPQWGATNLACQNCHLGTADVDNFTGTFWDNGITGIVKNAGEWDTTGHGKATGTYASGNTAALFTATNACLYCHDSTITHKVSANPFRLRNIADAKWGKNGNCQSCHATGSAGVTVDGVLKNGASKIDSTHYSAKHGTTNNGGQFCWDCHDPHGDSNRYMIHSSVARTSNSATGAPTNPVATTFTASATGTDYAKSTSPFDGVCNVCHTTTMHYTSTSGDSHMSTTRCTQCHNHTGKTTTDAFGVDCLSCHSTAQGNRAAVVGQLSGNSHHIQGVTLTNAHCYQCHWEANSDGSVNSTYHGGSASSAVNLVIYGNGLRPATYTVGTTAVEYTAGATSVPPPPPVVKVVDPWRQLTTSGTGSSRTATFTAGAGTVGSRMVMIGIAWEDSHSSGCNPSAITGNYGGQTITTINKANASNNREGQWMGYVREAGIAARSNNTITLTFSGCTPNLTPTISAATYEGVDQASAPASAIASGTTGSSFSWSGLPVVNGGYAMYNVNANGISSFTPPSTYTERYDVATTNFRMSGGDKAISADGTESKTVTGNTSSSRWALVAVSVRPSAGGSTGDASRTEIQKINQHCLSCHSAQNNATQPFGDGKIPKQYAWDGTSVGERYSQTGTTPWGKYSAANVTPKNTQIKAYSAHGNAANNQRGWNTSETWPNTSGTVNIACFDCHNSHGSTVNGITTSYPTPATTNGGILKDTTAGKGGYAMSYKPQPGGSPSNKNAYNPGAALCFDCHMTQNSGTTPWGYQRTFGATQAIYSYFEKPYWYGAAGVNPAGAQQRYAYKNAIGSKGGHFSASSALTTQVMGTIGGLCTPCHDPHGVSPTLNQQYSMPLLKGTWMTSPYKEDFAPLATNEQRGGGKDVRVFSDASTPGYHIDQNTFDFATTHTSGGDDHSGYSTSFTWNFNSTKRVTETADQFGGLCLRCHPKSSIGPGTNSTWKSVDRIHNTVQGWGTFGANANNAAHSFTCSKCHTPHNACLNRLMITNCLDFTHRGQKVSGGPVPPMHSARGKKGSGKGQFPAGGGGRGDEKAIYPGPFFFGTTSGGRACHDNTNSDSYPSNQRWNVKTPW